MSRSLPPNPSLRFLHEEAKDLLKAQRRKDPATCATLRLLRRFRDAGDDEILAAEIALHEAQFALAMDYRFPSWDALVQKVKAAGEAGAVFQGDRLRQDTFSLAVTAALGALGRTVDYRSVYLWSCNAFAPDIRPEEPTRCHWQLQGRERCLHVIAAGAGVQVRVFPHASELADIPPKPKDDIEKGAWIREYYRKPAASYLSHSLQAGEMVVSCGEWAQPIQGVLWCDWGMVVEARNDGTILGAAPNGRSDNPITHVRDGWVLRPGGTPPPSDELRRMVLRRAVERIRSQGPAFVPGSRKVVFGLAAMDAWIAAMSQVPFDPQQWGGKDWSAGQARETAMPTLTSSKAAGTYLRELAGGLPPAPAAALRDAAGQYDRIVELLVPALGDSGPETYQAFMGDAAGQQKHVELALRPVRSCLETAAGLIDKALTAI